MFEKLGELEEVTSAQARPLSPGKDAPEPRPIHPPSMGNVAALPEVGGRAQPRSATIPINADLRLTAPRMSTWRGTTGVARESTVFCRCSPGDGAPRLVVDTHHLQDAIASPIEKPIRRNGPGPNFETSP